MFPNKRRRGRWIITEEHLCSAVTEALVNHKIAVGAAEVEIEIIAAERRDNKRLGTRLSSCHSPHNRDLPR